jgi:hypothetical protein
MSLWPSLAAIRAEIELMQNEVLDYLTRHSSESTPAEAA